MIFLGIFSLIHRSINNHTLAFQFILFTRQQIPEKAFQIFGRFLNAILDVWVIGSDKCIAEIFWIVSHVWLEQLLVVASNRHDNGQGQQIIRKWISPDKRGLHTRVGTSLFMLLNTRQKFAFSGKFVCQRVSHAASVGPVERRQKWWKTYVPKVWSGTFSVLHLQAKQ